MYQPLPAKNRRRGFYFPQVNPPLGTASPFPKCHITSHKCSKPQQIKPKIQSKILFSVIFLHW